MRINSIITDEVILQYSLRYCLSNNSYGVNIVCSEIKKNVEDLTSIGLSSMIKDLEKSIDSISNSEDRFQFTSLLNSLKSEYEGRKIK